MKTSSCVQILLVIIACFCFMRHTAADERIFMDVQINGKPVRFALDSGAEASAIFDSAAKRIGLRISTPPPNEEPRKDGKVRAGVSEPCWLMIDDATIKTRLLVAFLPPWAPLDADGFIAWSGIKDTILHIPAGKRKALPLKALPKDMAQWTKWNLKKGSRLLAIDLPGEGDALGDIYIDTGSGYGVELSSERWKEWRARNPDQPTSITAGTTLYGLSVSEESWAPKLAIGSFEIQNVPVCQAVTERSLIAKDHEATLCLAALDSFDAIIDGQNSCIYLKPCAARSVPYQYNRIGAVFVPKDKDSDPLVAHVAKNTPAYKAGVRDGDVLLAIDDLDVTKWKTDPKVLPLSRFWEQPAGTKLTLTLEQNGKKAKVAVIAEEIFPQAVIPEKQPAAGGETER